MPPSRRTFQVAIFGPPGAGKTSTLRGLHRILPSEQLDALVEIPSFSSYVGTVMFFDYRPAEFTKPSATFRFRTVSGNDQEGFFTLLGADALIFVADGRPSKRKANHTALSLAMKHFRTYPPSWTSLPIVVQLWNEGTEPYVDEFWKLVAQHGLPYRRRDPVRDIIRRGRIRSDVEYEMAQDGFGDERLSESEKEQLGAILAAYEGFHFIGNTD